MSAPLPDLHADPQAKPVRKRPVSVAVAFASAPGTIHTLEGEVRHAAGDAVLTGVRGERWPVRREAFLASYEPVPPVKTGEDGPYVKRPAAALALRVPTPLDVPVMHGRGTLHAGPGDWLLQYPDGEYGVLSDEIFAATYQDA